MSPPFNDLGGNNRAGTLISPRHFITANHYPMYVGTKITFVDNNNVPYERTITGVTNIAGADIDVSVLDSDVPDSITFYPLVASSTLTNKLHRFNYNDQRYPPLISINQEDYAYVHAYQGYSGFNGIYSIPNIFFHLGYNNLSSQQNFTPNAVTNFEKRKEFSGDLRAGDSGDANFLVIDGKLVLAGPHSDAGTAYYPGGFINEINTAMTTLGGGYQVTQLNTDCFTSYIINHVPVITLIGGVYYDISEEDSVTGNLLIDENVYFDINNPFFKFSVSDIDGDSVIVTEISKPAPYFHLASSSNIYTVTLSEPLSLNNLPIEVSAPGSRTHLYYLLLNDSQNPAATSSFPIYFTIKDNNRPLFSTSSYSFSIPENSTNSSLVGVSTSTLQSSEDTLSFQLLNNPLNAFAISSTGQITVTDSSQLNYEATTTLQMIVRATATLGGAVRQASTTLQTQASTSITRVTVNLTNVDEVAPVITTIASTTSDTTATISWTTNEAASSTIEYGPTASYGSISTSGTLATSHSREITGLTASTLYHFRVVVSDALNNTFTSTDYTFTTSPLIVSAPILTVSSATSISTSAATLNGTIANNNYASSTIRGFEYGLTTSYGATSSTSGTYNTGAFSQTLTGLIPSTLYHFRSFATNSGGTGVSSGSTFTTSAVAVVVVSSGGGGGGGGGGTVSTAVTPVATTAAVVTPPANALATVTCQTGQVYSTVSGAKCTTWGIATSQIPVATNQPTGVVCPTGYLFNIQTGTKCTTWSVSGQPSPSTSPTLVNQTTVSQNLVPVSQNNLNTSQQPGFIFNKDLSFGMTDSDVKALQQKLNSLGFTIASSGLGSAGNESTYFGQATKSGLIKYQVSKSIQPAVGYFGELTRNIINSGNVTSNIAIASAPTPATIPTSPIPGVANNPSVPQVPQLNLSTTCQPGQIYSTVTGAKCTTSTTTTSQIPSVLNPITQASLTPGTTALQTTSNVNTEQPFQSTLKLGSTGLEVKKMRTLLRGLKYLDPYGTAGVPANASEETSYFGQTTVEIVKKFQCDNSIACVNSGATNEYGIVGTLTRVLLNKLWK